MVTTIDTGAWVTNARWWTSEEQEPIESLRNARHFTRFDLISPGFQPSKILSKPDNETKRSFCFAIGNSLIVFSRNAEEGEKNLESVQEMIWESGCQFRPDFDMEPEDELEFEDMKFSPYDITTVSTSETWGIGIRLRPLGPGGNAFFIVDFWAPDVEAGIPCTPAPVRIF